METAHGTAYGNEDLRRAAEKAVEKLLKFTDTEAKRLDKSVGDRAYKWWTDHYVKSFFFALAAKGLTEKQLGDAMSTLIPLAMVLGRAAACFADQEHKTEIDAGHAARASQIVDCPILSREVQDQVGIRAEWCN